jgi:hypothetical protein
MRKNNAGLVAGLVVAAALSALPATAADRTIQGVDWNAVPWETFCPSVKPVTLHTKAGDCPVSHPASQKHAAWNDFGMGTKQPAPNCEHAEHEYRWWTTPPPAQRDSTRPDRAWVACQQAWRSALKRRAREPESFEEPFEQWRARYFGPWLVGTAR